MIKLYISGRVALSDNQHDAALQLLDYALNDTYGLSLSSFSISKSPSGKPYFSNCDKIKFNLSHSGDYVTAAISDAEVGVDIECIKPVKAGVVERYLRGIIRGTGDEDIIEAWCRRESYGKFTGEGFVRADFSLPHHIEILRLIPGYIIAVCSAEKAEIIFSGDTLGSF